jgi:AraC-like DNA-binding protein
LLAIVLRRDFQRLYNPADGSTRIKPRAVLIGQPTVVTQRQFTGPDFCVLQVELRPGALFRLTALPARLLTDTFVDAESVFGAAIRKVNQRLTSTDSYQEMIQVVEDFLLKTLNRSARRSVPVDQFAGAMLRNAQRLPVDAMARASALSGKQFCRKFAEHMGVSPRLYQRISCLDQVIKYKNAHPETDWPSIALDFQYYDYQHLARDFRQFTAMKPRQFLAREHQAPERPFGVVET